MIKNNIYTYNYFQPDEYRFSLDSVFLAQVVAKNIASEHLENWKCLDLCAGCGIIGLELSLHSPPINHFDFLEVQEVYRDFFNQNLKMIYPENNKNFNFINLNYESMINNFEFQNKYDLIVSNPPYFFSDEGLLSPSEFKNRCRFFLDSNFTNLIAAILFVLKPNSSAYLLLRPGTHHGRDLFKEVEKLCEEHALVQIFDNIRGTNVVQITKK